MKRAGIIAAAIPGLVIAAVSVAGWVPTIRDLPTYFLPLRVWTARVLVGAVGPYWNPAAGCGEPFFANPQSCLLYPPAWLAALISPSRALGVEVGLHLAILAVGAAVLACTLGARSRLWHAAAGWGTVLSGPILDSAGVLNNLESVTWAPWLWIAALRGNLPAIAVFTALAWLGAEPQLAVLAVLVAVLIAPGRTVVKGAVLGFCVVAAQLVPFVWWVLGGDRGPGRAVEEVSAGALRLRELAALAFQGVDVGARLDPYVVNLALPLWILVLAALALIRTRGPCRRLAAWGFVLVATTVAAGLPLLDQVWAHATLGLVRYPSRLLFLAVPMLAPAAAAAASGLRLDAVRTVVGAAILAVAGVTLGASAPTAAVQALTAGLAVAGPLSALGGLAGTVAVAPPHLAALHWEFAFREEIPACIEAQTGAGRTYVVEPSKQQISWMREAPLARAAALGYGYLPLLDNREMTRTFAPVKSRFLLQHLGKADQGPAGRWWLDSLGADRVVAQHPVPLGPALCSGGELTVYENSAAWPRVLVAADQPEPDRGVVVTGTVERVRWKTDSREVRVVSETGGWLVWLETPDPGWRFSVDGVGVAPASSGGIIQAFPIDGGEHLVGARYRPPGILPGVLLSFAAIVLLVGLRLGRWGRSGGIDR